MDILTYGLLLRKIKTMLDGMSYDVDQIKKNTEDINKISQDIAGLQSDISVLIDILQK